MFAVGDLLRHHRSACYTVDVWKQLLQNIHKGSPVAFRTVAQSGKWTELEGSFSARYVSDSSDFYLLHEVQSCAIAGESSQLDQEPCGENGWR
jgi:hypothetical protein